MTNLKPYILDNAATAEYQRLDLMSKILDPWTKGYLRTLGLGPGWRCLELGSGNGSVAEWLCAEVGPAGTVTAVDVNPVLVELVLPGMVSRLRLGRPGAKTDVQNIRGRDRGARYFQLFFAEVRDRVLESGRLDASTFDRAAAFLDDPDYWTQCWMMTAVWMRKSRAA